VGVVVGLQPLCRRSGMSSRLKIRNDLQCACRGARKFIPNERRQGTEEIDPSRAVCVKKQTVVVEKWRCGDLKAGNDPRRLSPICDLGCLLARLQVDRLIIILNALGYTRPHKSGQHTFILEAVRVGLYQIISHTAALVHQGQWACDYKLIRTNG
jgi:hypothetical protein